MEDKYKVDLITDEFTKNEMKECFQQKAREALNGIVYNSTYAYGRQSAIQESEHYLKLMRSLDNLQEKEKEENND